MDQPEADLSVWIRIRQTTSYSQIRIITTTKGVGAHALYPFSLIKTVEKPKPFCYLSQAILTTDHFGQSRVNISSK